MPTVSIKVLDQTGESAFEAEIDKGVVYDELDKAGHQLPHGCLAGSCGSCRIQIHEGAELLEAPSAIESDTIEHVAETHRRRFGETKAGLRMACRAKVRKAGALTISPLK